MLRLAELPTHIRNLLKQSLRAIRLVWDSAPGWFAVSMAIAVVKSFPPLILLFFTKTIIDTLTGDLVRQNATSEQIFSDLIPVIAGVLVTMFAIVGLEYLDRYISLIQAQKLETHVYSRIHKKSVELDLEYYENSAHQNIMHMAQQQTLTRPRALVDKLTDLVEAVFSGVAIIGLLLAFNPIIVLIFVAVVIPGVILKVVVARRQYSWDKKDVSRARLISYLSGLLISAIAAKEIRLNDLGPHLQQRYQQTRKQQQRELRRLGAMGILVDAVIQVSGILAIVSVYAYIIYLTVHNQLTIGQMVIYYQLFQRGQSIVQNITSSLTAFYENSLYAVSVFEFMDLPAVLARPTPEARREFPEIIREGICFENVTFQYPGNSTPTFQNLSLSIRPGEAIALVGINGAGKTTLVKLLCRLYDPTSGRITVDGIDLRDFDLADLRHHIGVIFQDHLGYSLSARDNIRFGNVNKPHDQGQVEAAAKLAGIHEKLASLKDGYETKLGRWLTDGAQLSGGEWQKLALARLFFRDAPIIVLDEPTSAIDALGEYQLFSRFREIVRGKIAILISHRLSTVQMADCIYIIENGSIVESGSHQTLLQADKTYAKLFKLQSQYYQRSHDGAAPELESS